MISEREIETYAEQIVSRGFEMAGIETLIGHLGDIEFEAVMRRAAAISRERGRAAFAEADSLEKLIGLAHSVGMPAGERPIPWLEARGPVEKLDDGGYRLKPARPGAATSV